MGNITLSLRGNGQIVGLFDLIGNTYLPELSRSEIISEAIDYVLENQDINLQVIAKIKNNIDFSINCLSEDIPNFIQLRVDEEKWAYISRFIANGFNPPLKKLQTPFLVKMILVAFLEKNSLFESEKLKDIVLPINSTKGQISEAIKDFVDMAFYDSDSDEFKEIFNLLKKHKLRK